jgi:hypothetical protein
MSISALQTSSFSVSLLFFMGIATPSPAQAIKPVPPTPIDMKKVELGGTGWNPQWDQIIRRRCRPKYSLRGLLGGRRFCPRFYEWARGRQAHFSAYFFQALAGGEPDHALDRVPRRFWFDGNESNVESLQRNR